MGIWTSLSLVNYKVAASCCLPWPTARMSQARAAAGDSPEREPVTDPVLFFFSQMSVVSIPINVPVSVWRLQIARHCTRCCSRTVCRQSRSSSYVPPAVAWEAIIDRLSAVPGIRDIRVIVEWGLRLLITAIMIMVGIHHSKQHRHVPYSFPVRIRDPGVLAMSEWTIGILYRRYSVRYFSHNNSL